MAEIITKFKLESTQYESKLRDCAQALKEVTRHASLAGKDFNGFSQKSIEGARALGNIATSATNVKDKVKELVSAFNTAANAYNSLNEQQKSGEYGKAMAASLQTLRERISEAKGEMQQMQTQTSSSGGIMQELAGKVGISAKAFSAFGVASAAAGAALKVAKDAFFESETNVDEWGRTVAVSESLYKSFLNSLNSSDFSGFLTGINNVVNAAKEAYNAIDELHTRMTIINPERARLQKEQARLQATIKRNGKDSKEGQAAQAQLKALEPQMTQSYFTEAKLNKDAFVKFMISRAAEGGVTLTKEDVNRLLPTFSNDRLYNQFRANAKGSAHTQLGPHSGYSGGVKDTRNLNAKLADIFTDDWRNENSGYLTAAFNAETAAYNNIKGNARYLPSPTTTPKRTTTHTPRIEPPKNVEEVLPAGSMAQMNKELSDLNKAQSLVTSTEEWKNYQTQIDEVSKRMKALRGEVEEVKKEEEPPKINMLSSTGLGQWKQQQLDIAAGADYGSTERKNALANAADTQTFSNLLTFADENNITIPDNIKETLSKQLSEGLNLDDEKFQEFIDVLNEKLQNMGLDPIVVDFDTSAVNKVQKTTKTATGSWKEAANAVSQVGNALQQIEDPSVKIMGIIGEAIASIALAMAQATSKEAGGGVWAWIAAIAAGTATMISTIASIKAATAGSYAEGGIIPGNSPTGDLLTANVNSGELILNRAQQDSVAAQLNTSGARSIVLDTRLRGEDLYLVQRTYERRKGWTRKGNTN